MIGIFYVSGIPDLGPLPAHTSDKAAHFAAYIGLGVLLARAMAGADWSRYTWASGTVAWILAVLFAWSDEFHQSFVPGRTPSLGDGVADAGGAAVGVAVAVAAARWLARRSAGNRAV
jgi:VanZ family protein